MRLIRNRLLDRITFVFVLIGMFLLMDHWIGIKPCAAKEVNEINVELIWQFDDAGWVEISIEQGTYLFSETNAQGKTSEFSPKGVRLELLWGGWTPVIRKNYNDYEIWEGSEILLTPEDEKGVFRIRTPEGESVSYRGGLRIKWEVDHWQLTNSIDSEDYLKGVVPIEMSNSWADNGIEALKAQAVSARTYMIRKLRTNAKITDSPDHDQAYLGLNVEGAASQAVDETRGEILVDSSDYYPIDALYSSHNGGYTEFAENVWSNSDPHFSSHPDPFSEGIGGAADRWRFIIGADYLGTVFDLGPIQSIHLEKLPSGRVKKVTLTDVNAKTKTLSGRELVQKFYPFGQPIQTYAFLGNLFDVQKLYASEEKPSTFSSQILTPEAITEYKQSFGPRLNRIISSSKGIREVPSTDDVYIFWGRGWGHGVGMSQWGAYQMAQRGYTYEEILDYYYKNSLLIKDYI